MPYEKQCEVEYTEEERSKVLEQFDKLWATPDSQGSKERKQEYNQLVGDAVISLTHADYDAVVKVLRYMTGLGLISLDEIAHGYVC